MLRRPYLLLLLLLTARVDAEDIFAYQRDAPWKLEVAGKSVRGEAIVQDLSFDDGSGGRITAYLVTPQSKGPHPGILFVHWLDGKSPDSNRTEFLEEAVELSKNGVESLLVNAMWSGEKWFVSRKQEDDLKNTGRQIAQLQRAVDFLASRPTIDQRRLAFVGHDFGAMCGAVLAGMDKRISAWVFMAGVPSFSDWYLYFPKLEGEKRDAFIAELSVIDPARHIAKAAPAPVFFQFGKTDQYVSEEQANKFFGAAADPKEVRFYESGHALNESAAQDRVSWLRRRLVPAEAAAK